ncbi:MAG: hypothetical protein KatS3mg111_2358 [Pirellulaceae bacterium]|nr:MAG: hypothetical protein KatS3mg111_2358 [Pirellulaceae bacterium]
MVVRRFQLGTPKGNTMMLLADFVGDFCYLPWRREPGRRVRRSLGTGWRVAQVQTASPTSPPSLPSVLPSGNRRPLDCGWGQEMGANCSRALSLPSDRVGTVLPIVPERPVGSVGDGLSGSRNTLGARLVWGRKKSFLGHSLGFDCAYRTCPKFSATARKLTRRHATGVDAERMLHDACHIAETNPAIPARSIGTRERCTPRFVSVAASRTSHTAPRDQSAM